MQPKLPKLSPRSQLSLRGEVAQLVSHVCFSLRQAARSLNVFLLLQIPFEAICCRIKQILWFNLAVVTLIPLLAFYGSCTTKLDSRTLLFCVFLYLFNMIGMFFLGTCHIVVQTCPQELQLVSSQPLIKMIIIDPSRRVPSPVVSSIV